MGYQADIQKLRQNGIADPDIATYYSEKLTAGGIGQADIGTWLGEQGLTASQPAAAPTIPEGSAETPGFLGPQEFMRRMTQNAPVEGGGRFALGMAGSMAAPMLAPQLAGGGALTALGNLALKSGAAGAGAGVGSSAGQLIDTGATNPIETAKDTGLAMGGEAVFGPLAAGIKRIAAPALGKIDGAGRKIMELAKAKDIPLSPARTTSGGIAKALDATADVTFLGRLIKHRYQARLMSQLTERAKGMANEFGLPAATKADAGQAMGRALDKDVNAVFADYNAAVDQVATANHDEIYLEGTTDLLNAWKRKYGSPQKVIRALGITDAGQQQAVREFMDPELGDVTNAATIKYFLAKVFKGGKWSDLAPNAQKLREQVKTAIISDIDNMSGGGQQAAQAKAMGDAVYKSTKQFLAANPQAARIIAPMRTAPGATYYGTNPEGVVDILAKTQDVDQLLQIKNFVSQQPALKDEAGNVLAPSGEQAWEMFKFAYLDDLYKQALKQNPVSGETVFQPARFAELVGERAEVIKAAMPDIWPQLAEEAELARVVAPEFIAGAAKLTESLAIPGMVQGAATFAAGPAVGLVGPSVFGSLSAWGLMSQNSKNLIRKWLEKETIGPVGKAAAGAVKEGGKAALLLGGQPVFSQ